MKQRLVIVILFALVISAAASAVLYRLISTQLAANREGGGGGKVLVAARNLGSGELIKDADVKIVDWSGPVPIGALVKPEDAIGRGIVESIYQNEPIMDARMAARGAGAGLAAIIPQGMRAVAVRINDVVGVSGFAVVSRI